MTTALNTHKQLERKATTMTNAHNTVANQYLNSILRVGAKPLMLISILLTAMFILAACGGGGAAAPTVTPTANPCDTNPFGTGCNSPENVAARTTVVQTCLAAGAANTPACADAIVAEPCIVNPQADACATDEDFIAYLPTGTDIDDVRDSRTNFCERPENRNTAAICGGVLANCNAANPFANDLCDTATGITALRTTYCNADATLWNDNCDAGEATYAGATAKRNAECLAEGTDADPSCESRANVRTACNANPFTQTTGSAPTDLCTGSTADTGGMEYSARRIVCETIATSFTDYCAGADTGETKVKIARDMACETLTATGAGTGNNCAV
nr:hypothetical protein [Pseudomonadota bacterium]